MKGWDEIRKIRRRMRIVVGLMIAFVVSVFIVTLIISINKGADDTELLDIVFRMPGLVTGLAALFVSLIYIPAFNKAFKPCRRLVVENAMSSLFEKCSFYPDRGLKGEALMEKEVVEIPRDFGSNCLLTGEYHDIQFVRADINLPSAIMSGEKNFRGSWTIFSFPKAFQTDLVVYSRSYIWNTEGKSVLPLSPKRPKTPFQTGNDEFDNFFVCMSQNPPQAIKMLSPMVMKRLFELRRKTGVRFIIGWIGNNIHLIWESGKGICDQPRYFHEFSFSESCTETAKDLSTICEIIDNVIMSRSIYADYITELLAAEQSSTDPEEVGAH
ncbi:MAG: DUF3137 domain-containing protein [Lachnospiraceae bacterium]|nr:DUF3137 domain-containing protein [Lachnospiraceae bacterium]